MSKSTADLLETESYCKLLCTKTGPYCVIEVMPTTVTNDEDGIQNTISLDRVTVAIVQKKPPPEDNGTQSKETDAEREGTFAGFTR